MNFSRTMIRCKSYEAAGKLYRSLKRYARDVDVAISNPKWGEYYVEILISARAPDEKKEAK